MNMSLLMVVQPLLDAGRNMTSSASAKNQGNDASNPFQALLKGQMAAREPEKQIMPADSKEAVKQPSSSNEGQNTTDEASAKEPVKEGETAEATLPGKSDDNVTVEDDAAVLAQIMAATAGAQIVPVEPAPGNDTAELADEALVLAATEEESTGGRKMRATDEIEAGNVKRDTQEGGDEVTYDKVQADAGQNMKTPVDKPVAEAVAPKVAATDTAAAAVKPVAEQQPVSQTQQPVPTMSTQQVQQATVAPMTVEANPAATRVMQQMGSPEWNQAIGQRVLWMVGQEQQSASLTLNPPELGPVRVVVSVSNNNASANFFSANPDVRQALEGSLPRLREMMEGAGIQLGQAQVGAENSGNQQSGQASSSGGRTAGVTGDDGDIGNLTAVTDVPASGRMISKGLVDTFA
ncbi:flagellar hook-length control protein FliK [Oxalobacter vibrioformis]|uniref:Flagellar hook-length control protein FliK n=1 Tax=Oxalobacter vibrioformis TaxID=933080 RepID=A0A9E9LY26_9BURK|nr:flagellar hook-length control protein FliK [Oxalobacter vibrioformis]WAW09562.1 flagellar hook-length control protein FliK [Oxalobacter vibrioformis]